MPGLNEIKSSIANVKGTQKITRAMYLISASKSKAAREKLEKMRPHFDHIAITLSEIIAETEELNTPYLEKRVQPETGEANREKAEKRLYLVVAGDKGQAGSYNHNVINMVREHVSKEGSTLWVAGYTGRNLIIREGYHVSLDFNYPVMNPTLYNAREIAELVIEAFKTEGYERIYLIYTDMISPLKLEPRIIQLLPLKPEDLTQHITQTEKKEKAEYEPSPEAVFEHLTPHYIKSIIYGAFVDSFTSEQHARMFAMDNATKNANEMITNLSKKYNRLRQAQITQEINEIVAGIPAE